MHLNYEYLIYDHIMISSVYVPEVKIISVEADIVLFQFARFILIMQELHVNKKKSEYDQEIPQPTHGTVRKIHRTFAVTIHM